MFAGDTIISIYGQNMDELVKFESIVDKFSLWFQRNKLILNTSNSMQLKFNHRKIIGDIIYTFDDIQTVTEVKYPGTRIYIWSQFANS